MPEKKNHLKTVGLIMLISLVGKVMGLGRDMLQGHNFGTGMAANAFSTASLIPRTFFDAIFASAISASFIPVFNEYLERRGKAEAFRLSDAFVTLMALFTALLSALGMIFSGQLTALMVDFTGDTAALCAALLRLLFPTVVFTGVAFSLVGILQSLGEFNIPAAMSVVSNGVVIAYYFLLCDRFGVYGLAVAYLVGWALQAVIQIPPLHRLGYRYRPALFHPGLKQIFLLMLPVMVGTWVQPVNMLVSNKFASGLFDGAGSTALQQANTLYIMVAGIFVLSITNVIFPELSRLTAHEKQEEFGAVISTTLRAVLFLLLPLTVGLMTLSTPIVRLLYEWKEWTPFSTEITARSLCFLALGMVGYGVQNILSRAFYAQQKGLVPLITGAASIAVNAALCVLLAPALDVGGLALASAVSSTLSALLLLIPMGCRHRGMVSAAFWRDGGKMLLSALVMGLAVVLARNGLTAVCPDGLAGRLAVVALPTLTGMIVYFLCAWLLRIPELRRGMQSIQQILGK